MTELEKVGKFLICWSSLFIMVISCCHIPFITRKKTEFFYSSWHNSRAHIPTHAVWHLPAAAVMWSDQFSSVKLPPIAATTIMVETARRNQNSIDGWADKHTQKKISERENNIAAEFQWKIELDSNNSLFFLIYSWCVKYPTLTSNPYTWKDA